MAVAPTTIWNPAVTFIMRQALIKIGAIADDEQPTGPMYQDAMFALNGIVKTAEATGLHVWSEEEAILFVQPGQARYVIGDADPTANAHTSDAEDWLELVLSSNAVEGDTSIILTFALDIVSGTNVGVVLNNGLTFWTTATAAPTGNVVPLASPIPASGASAGGFVLIYQVTIGRPLKVPKARLLTLQATNGSGNFNETPMTIMSRQEYMDTPNKRSPGTPTQWFYSPRRDQGLLYIWPVPERSAWAIRFTWYRSLASLLTPANTLDFPQEWVLPLTWWLAKEIAPDYDCPPARYAMIEKQADAYADLVVSYDRESEPIEFGLEGWLYGR